MAKRYGHIGQVAQRQAVAVLDGKDKTSGDGKAKAQKPRKKHRKESPEVIPERVQ